MPILRTPLVELWSTIRNEELSRNYIYIYIKINEKRRWINVTAPLVGDYTGSAFIRHFLYYYTTGGFSQVIDLLIWYTHIQLPFDALAPSIDMLF